MTLTSIQCIYQIMVLLNNIISELRNTKSILNYVHISRSVAAGQPRKTSLRSVSTHRQSLTANLNTYLDAEILVQEKTGVANFANNKIHLPNEHWNSQVYEYRLSLRFNYLYPALGHWVTETLDQKDNHCNHE
jgi:hypothetical protein